MKFRINTENLGYFIMMVGLALMVSNPFEKKEEDDK